MTAFLDQASSTYEKLEGSRCSYVHLGAYRCSIWPLWLVLVNGTVSNRDSTYIRRQCWSRLFFLITIQTVSRKHPSSSLNHARAIENHIVFMPDTESINHTNQIKVDSKKPQTIKSLPRPRLPSSLTRLVLPRAPPSILRNWWPLTVSEKAALRYQKTMARLSTRWSTTRPMSLADIT